MAELFRYLFTPFDLGKITVRNRIVSTAHATGYVKEGIPTEQEAAYQEARARGGMGLKSSTSGLAAAWAFPLRPIRRPRGTAAANASANPRVIRFMLAYMWSPM